MGTEEFTLYVVVFAWGSKWLFLYFLWFINVITWDIFASMHSKQRNRKPF